MSFSKRLITTALFALVVALGAASPAKAQQFVAPVCVSLYDLMEVRDVEKLNALFNGCVDLGSIGVVACSIDGPGGIIGMVNIRPDRQSHIIFIDNDDVDLAEADINRDERFRKILIHEIIHIAQTAYSAEQRQRMITWCRTLPYEKRPHEIDAYKRASQMNEKWKTYEYRH